MFWLGKSTYTFFLPALLLPALKIPIHPSCSQYIVAQVLNPSPNMQTLPNEASVAICSLVYSGTSAKSDDSGCPCLRHSGCIQAAAGNPFLSMEIADQQHHHQLPSYREVAIRISEAPHAVCLLAPSWTNFR
jgi:hypothetical protein